MYFEMSHFFGRDRAKEDMTVGRNFPISGPYFPTLRCTLDIFDGFSPKNNFTFLDMSRLTSFFIRRPVLTSFTLKENRRTRFSSQFGGVPGNIFPLRRRSKDTRNTLSGRLKKARKSCASLTPEVHLPSCKLLR